MCVSYKICVFIQLVLWINNMNMNLVIRYSCLEKHKYSHKHCVCTCKEEEDKGIHESNLEFELI